MPTWHRTCEKRACARNETRDQAYAPTPGTIPIPLFRQNRAPGIVAVVVHEIVARTANVGMLRIPRACRGFLGGGRCRDRQQAVERHAGHGLAIGWPAMRTIGKRH